MPRPNRKRMDGRSVMVRLSPGEDGDLDRKARVERVDRSTLMRRALAAYYPHEPGQEAWPAETEDPAAP